VSPHWPERFRSPSRRQI